MALIGAFGDSNAARPSSPQDGATGGSNAAMTGYSLVTSDGAPATANSQIRTIGDGGAGKAGDVQQGTSQPAYKEQPPMVSGESGK